jgi:hypothetical protein
MLLVDIVVLVVELEDWDGAPMGRDRDAWKFI